MKKYVFYLSLILSILLLLNIISILIADLDRLTQYGYGYLLGKLILFLLFVGIALLTRKSNAKTKSLR